VSANRSSFDEIDGLIADFLAAAQRASYPERAYDAPIPLPGEQAQLSYGATRWETGYLTIDRSGSWEVNGGDEYSWYRFGKGESGFFAYGDIQNVDDGSVQGIAVKLVELMGQLGLAIPQ
jgi:hypothetical protein